jgi:hypothetical protein
MADIRDFSYWSPPYVPGQAIVLEDLATELLAHIITYLDNDPESPDKFARWEDKTPSEEEIMRYLGH